MKKVFITLLVMSIGLCAYAVSWKKITDKIYLDISGITPDGRLNNVYSFWTKELNDGTADFIIAERNLGQKVWYDLVRYSVDCANHKIRLDDIVVFGLKNDMLSSTSMPADQWHTVPPESIAQDYMSLVCKSRPIVTSSSAPSTVSEPSKGAKVGTLGKLSFTEVDPYKITPTKPQEVVSNSAPLPEVTQPSQVKQSEPVAIDYNAYMKKVQAKVQSNWKKPENSANKKVTLIFSISSSGTLVTLSEFKASGDKAFDNLAMDAIKSSVPFPPMPAGYKGKGIDVQLTFDETVHGFILSK